MKSNKWQTVRLGDVWKISSGKGKPKEQGEYPAYGGNGITDYVNSYNVDSPTLIIGRVGAYCGNVFLTNESIWVTDNALYTKELSSNVLIKFLYYSLKNIDLSRYSRGSAQPLVTQESLRMIEIPLPPIAEQERIAGILSSFDEKIELNQQICRDLERMARLLFRRDFLDHPERDTWEVAKLGDVAEFVKGKKPEMISSEFESDFLPYLTIAVLESKEKLYADPKKTVLCTENDLIMVMDGASSGRVYLGVEGVVGSTCSKIVSNIDKNILYCLLKYNEDFITSHLTGSAIPHTDKKMVLGIELPIPPKESLQVFEEMVAPMFEQIKTLQNENIQLTEMRDLLLKKLMSPPGDENE
ncbi:MAG: restriction endonuclease subunit S [Brevinema sp.]